MTYIFAEGDRVAFRWSIHGTHLGDWLGIPPTGNHVTATGISVYRIAGGRVVDELRFFTGDGWEQEDDITLVTLQRSKAT